MYKRNTPWPGELDEAESQAWFYSSLWQKAEREADADIVAGRVILTDGIEDFIAELDE
jgi:hypothetical protein